MAGPTFADIARRAGVGTATVERVLNGRGGVSPATTEKVVAAARALDYPRRLPEAHRGLLRLDVLLVRPESSFFRRLSRAFERIGATLDPVVRVHRSFLDETRPETIAERLLAPGHRRAGLIAALPNHPAIAAALARTAGAGVPVVQIVSRAAPGVGVHVGIDNAAAGRSAALYVARMQPRAGAVIAICNPIYQVHRERIGGFTDGLARHSTGRLDFRWVAFGRDDPDRAADILRRALAEHPDIVALYNAGGANTALLEVLRRLRRADPVFFVGHELTDTTAAALADGTMAVVLDQAPEAQARRAMDLLLRQLGLLRVDPDTSPIRFVTVTAENL